MFGLFQKKTGFQLAQAHLKREFGLTLQTVPGKETLPSLFENMTGQRSLSEEAQTALLYRLVIMNFLLACKIMRDKGDATPASDLMWLTQLSDSSVTWSERAPDHEALEQLTSQLNMNIVRFLESFGVRKGGG